jgi:hypothetical protein
MEKSSNFCDNPALDKTVKPTDLSNQEVKLKNDKKEISWKEMKRRRIPQTRPSDDDGGPNEQWYYRSDFE